MNTSTTSCASFPGQYFDAETNLHYNYFRDYDPRTGRYIESDPVGLQGGLNTYLYAFANPNTKIDPYGLYGGCGQGQAPDANGTCRPDPWNRPEDPCNSWECRVYTPDTNTQKGCILICSATAGTICGYILRTGLTPLNLTAYAICRAAVAKTCKDKCEEAYCNSGS